MLGDELWGWVMGAPSIMFTFSRWEFPLSLSSQCSSSVAASVRASPVPHPLVLGQWSIFSCSALLLRAVRGKVKGICRCKKNWCLWQLGFSPRVCDPGREVDVVRRGRHSPVLLRGCPTSVPLSFMEFPFSF